jgi:putative FmdB family regulatory protein
MPLYEYTCRQCKHTFEELVSGSEAIKCPQCRTHKVERMLSVPARPQTAPSALPTACGEGPPCGAPWCQRK